LTEIVAHRRNHIHELLATPVAHGVEIDIRTRGDDLITQHDPFEDGDRLEDWIKCYRHALLILNVKEEGLEDRVLALMAQHGIERFFFLDQSFPFLIRTARLGERRCAVRVSEYEACETALRVAPLIDWVWIDYFNHFPLSGDDARALKSAGLRFCLVSPELHGHAADTVIPELRRHLDELSIPVDAVCTKRADLWA
jgi:hypothetical protein